MPNPTLAKALILPELKLLSHKGLGLFVCDKVSALEVCPKCAKPSGSIYDHRWVTLKDAPIQDRLPTLRVLKRRFYCQSCRKPFTEPLPGRVHP